MERGETLKFSTATRKGVGREGAGWIAKIDRGPGARSLKMTIFQKEWPSYCRAAQSITTATSTRDPEEMREIMQNSFDELINYCGTLKNPHTFS